MFGIRSYLNVSKYTFGRVGFFSGFALIIFLIHARRYDCHWSFYGIKSKDILADPRSNEHCKEFLGAAIYPAPNASKGFQVVEYGKLYVYSAYMDMRFKPRTLVRVTGLFRQSEATSHHLWCILWCQYCQKHSIVKAHIDTAESPETKGR